MSDDDPTPSQLTIRRYQPDQIIQETNMNGNQPRDTWTTKPSGSDWEISHGAYPKMTIFLRENQEDDNALTLVATTLRNNYLISTEPYLISNQALADSAEGFSRLLLDFKGPPEKSLEEIHRMGEEEYMSYARFRTEVMRSVGDFLEFGGFIARQPLGLVFALASMTEC